MTTELSVPTEVKATRTRHVFARLDGGATCFIELDKGVGAATFQRMCGHPQQWFTDDDGDRVRATSIVAFRVLTEKECRKLKKRIRG